MKNFIFTLILSVSLILGGCVAQGTIPSPNDSAYPAYVISAERDVKTYTSIFTATYLIVGDAKEQTKNARLGNKIAKDIVDNIDNELTIDGLKTYAFNLVAKNTGEEDRIAVGVLLSSVSTLIEDKVKFEFPELPESEKVALTKQFIKAAASTVIEITEPFNNNPKPTTSNTLSSN